MSVLGLDISPFHFPVAPLRDGRTKIIASRSDATRCVLFVHGFAGDALETWKGFETRALTNEDFKGTDLVFFGYDGLRSNALASSGFLFDLMDEMLTSPDMLIGFVRANMAPYSRCVLVAHSLGAVVSRWALLRAHESHCKWLEHIRYLLFAPAHRGGIIVDSLSKLLGGNVITKALADVAKLGVPLLNELEANSAMLKSLERQTRAAVKSGCKALRPSRVVIAEYEDVVSNLPFPGDPYPTAIRDARHTSVCKPAEFLVSIDFVKELLP
jgi:triacylglycerol esterase/lipase EstA (alpha/beta hydrolase family)